MFGMKNHRNFVVLSTDDPEVEFLALKSIQRLDVTDPSGFWSSLIHRSWGSLVTFGENANFDIICEKVSLLISTLQQRRIDEVVEVEVGKDVFPVRVYEINFISFVSGKQSVSIEKKLETSMISVADNSSSGSTAGDDRLEKLMNAENLTAGEVEAMLKPVESRSVAENSSEEMVVDSLAKSEGGINVKRTKLLNYQEKPSTFVEIENQVNDRNGYFHKSRRGFHSFSSCAYFSWRAWIDSTSFPPAVDPMESSLEQHDSNHEQHSPNNAAARTYDTNDPTLDHQLADTTQSTSDQEHGSIEARHGDQMDVENGETMVQAGQMVQNESSSQEEPTTPESSPNLRGNTVLPIAYSVAQTK
ncbi:hypothetical protein V6N13_121826 [Hibiscus sabdariffa]